MARRKRKKPADPREALISATMALAARMRWRDIRMGHIADEAGLTLPEAMRIFPNKSSVLSGVGRAINDTVLAGLVDDPEIGETVKDRLFDVVMRRFDAMSDYKPGLAGASAAISRDPVGLLCRLREIHAAMTLTLEAAGVSTSGPLGRLRVHGLSAIYANALRVWFRDDSPDMEKTMAAVDRGLSFADRAMTQWQGPDHATG